MNDIFKEIFKTLPAKKITLNRPNNSTPVNWHEDFIVHIASLVQPKVYVELGLYHCDLFNRIVPFASKLIGVDISNETNQYISKSQKVTFKCMTTIEYARTLSKKSINIDLLFIDADHSEKSVKEDFNNFFPFVNDQGLIILHDGYPKDKKSTQPGYCGDGYKAIEDLSKERDNFELVTLPIAPGLSLCRKRSKQIPWK